MENLVENYLPRDVFSTKDSNFGLPIGTNLSFIKPKASTKEYNFNNQFSTNFTPITAKETNNTLSVDSPVTEIFGASSQIVDWIPKLDITDDLIFADQTLQASPTDNTRSVGGTKAFNDAFDIVQMKMPEIKKYRPFLTKLAQRESSFNPRARANNSTGTALGYFQFMPFNRKGLSEQSFTNNPELQIEMAYKLLKVFKNSFDSTYFAKAKARGYSESAIVAGAWLGGPNGVKKFLNTGFANQDNLGTNVKNYMDKFNNLT